MPNWCLGIARTDADLINRCFWMPCDNISLETIDEDTLILIFSHLPIPGIISLRRVRGRSGRKNVFHLILSLRRVRDCIAYPPFALSGEMLARMFYLAGFLSQPYHQVLSWIVSWSSWLSDHSSSGDSGSVHRRSLGVYLSSRPIQASALKKSDFSA